MSYILEALKKAQAERQLGSAPTIHAAPFQPMPAGRERARGMPLLIALGAVAVLVAGGVAWWTQRTAAPAPVAGAVVQGGPAGTAAPAPVVALVPVPVQAPGQSAPGEPAAVPSAAFETARAPVRGASAVAAAQQPMPAARPPLAAARVAPPVTARSTAPVALAEVAAAAPEESLPLMSQLPESQRAGLPQIAFGGYMYSKNPADRLLLIDKVLRREGEEVAPGLILERLLPRAAVMNYRGTRYRVPY